MSKQKLESARKWVKAKTLKERDILAKSMDYPQRSMSKFATGEVYDPGYLRVSAILRKKEKK